MHGFRFIQATDIVSWAGRRADAPALLPVLVRKLVIATSPPATFADFPGDKGVSSPGWDGWVKNGAHPIRYIPAQESVWELSVNGQVFRKATKDFATRSKFPSSLDPAKSAFVAVTARAWRAGKGTDKHSWAASMKKKGIWADVVAYDAHDLAAWTELAPSVAMWFGQQIGLPYPRSVRDLPCITGRFLHQFPPPPLDLDALLITRDAERDRVHAWPPAMSTTPHELIARPKKKHEPSRTAMAQIADKFRRSSLPSTFLSILLEEDWKNLY